MLALIFGAKKKRIEFNYVSQIKLDKTQFVFFLSILNKKYRADLKNSSIHCYKTLAHKEVSNPKAHDNILTAKWNLPF